MISRLVLNHFKCFEHQEIKLAPLTVLAGLNSTGKSSVLEAMLLLRQSREQYDSALCLKGPYVDLGTGMDVLCEYSNDDNIGIHLYCGEQQYGGWWSSNQEGAILPQTRAGGRRGNQQECSLFSRQHGSWLQFTYLSAERIGPRTSYAISPERMDEDPELGRCGEYAAQYLEKVANRDIPIVQMKLGDDGVMAVQTCLDEWMRVISPGVHLTVASYADIDMVKFRYQYPRNGVQGREYRPVNVGFGLTAIMPVILALLTTQKGGLLLLENLEIHIHPKGQTYLGKLMALAAQNGVQVIVETHSDHIINGIRLAVKQHDMQAENGLIQFFSDSVTTNGISLDSVHIKEDGKLDAWPQDFMSEWEDSLMKLL